MELWGETYRRFKPGRRGLWVTGHRGGMTPARFSALLTGEAFRRRQARDNQAVATAWAIQYAFADEGDRKKLLVSLGIDEPEKPVADVEARMEFHRKLLRKIETSEIAFRRPLSLNEAAAMLGK